MHPIKALGLDGLSTAFFQKFWHIIEKDDVSLTLDIPNNNRSPKDINKTYIALIPKVKNPTTPKDYKPISLCNVMLKLVIKGRLINTRDH